MKALFEIGQKVVCVDSKPITGPPPPLIEGKEYVIMALNECKWCGHITVDVGLTSYKIAHLCSACHCLWAKQDNTHWCVQTRFVPLDFDRQADEEIHEALRESLKINNPR